MTIKLLNNKKLLNIIKNKYCILCMKNYLLKIMDNVTVGKNFEKLSMLNYFQ